MTEAVRFFYDNFGSRLTAVTRKGNTVQSKLKGIGQIHPGHCGLSGDPDTEVVDWKRGAYDGALSLDWRLLAVFSEHNRNGASPRARFGDHAIVLIKQGGALSTMDVVAKNIAFLPRSDIIKIVVAGKVDPPFMFLVFSKNSSNVARNLRLTYSRDLVDLAGARSGIVRLSMIRTVRGLGADKKLVNAWRGKIRAGKADPGDQICQELTRWSDLEYEFFRASE